MMSDTIPQVLAVSDSELRPFSNEEYVILLVGCLKFNLFFFFFTWYKPTCVQDSPDVIA